VDAPYLEITGIRFRANHGVWPEEKRNPQTFRVNVALYGAFATNAESSDALADTIDYSAVCARVVDVATEARVDLIEHLAAKIAEALVSGFPIGRVLVTLIKQPPPGVVGSPEQVAVRVVRERRA